MANDTTDSPRLLGDGPKRAREQGFLDIDHIPEIKARYIRGSRWHSRGNSAQLAAEYGVDERAIRGAAHGQQCRANQDGQQCLRSGEMTRGWCERCYQWSMANGWADPPGRRLSPVATSPGRAHGTVMDELRAAAYATTNDCVDYVGVVGRPHVHVDGGWKQSSRMVWIIRHGDPGSAHVLHTCNRGREGCVNIRHLYLGDPAQNSRDKVDAGRQVRGEECWMAVLTEPNVIEIRRRYAAGGISQQALGAEYGVSQHAIHAVVSGKSWAWLRAEEHGSLPA